MFAPALRDARGVGFGGITLFPRPIVDDDAPLTLQPFLQRATEIHVGGDGGAAVTEMLWMTPRIGASFAYAPSWISVGGPSPRNDVEHLFTLTLFARPR